MDDILKNSMTGITPLPKPQAQVQTALPKLPKLPPGLTVPTPARDNRQYIETLSRAQKQPNAIMNLQRAMQLSSRVAYNQRQAKEMEITGRQFDPTKVSGGTFAGIIGNLEARRGFDVSKIYASTMQTYQTVQQEISRRLENLQAIEESKRRWEEEMELKKEEMEEAKKYNKKEYEMKKEQFEMAKKDWELSYSKASKGASGYSSGYLDNLMSGFKDITQGQDGYLDPREFNQWTKDALTNAQTKSDLSTLSTYLTRARDLLNPSDIGTTNTGWGK